MRPINLGRGGTGAGGAGGGTLQVEPLQLRNTAGNANRIGDEMLQTVRGQADSLGRSGQSNGLALSSALAGCATAWQQELTNTAQAVHGVGAKLNTIADSYAAVDQQYAEVFNDMKPRA